MSVSTPGVYQVKVRHAVSVGNVLLTELLIAKAGGEVNTHYEDGVTLLHVATSQGHVEVVKILIQAGGEVNSQTKEGTNLSGGWLDGWPLRVVTVFGHEVVVLLC